MRRRRITVAALAAIMLLGMPATAGAHPEDGGGEGQGWEHFHGGPTYDPTHSSHGNADLASPNMFHTANRANPGRTNTDLAFWSEGGVRGPHQHLAAAGNYDGFRLFDIKDPDNPVLVTDFQCRGPQNDVSFYRAQDRLLLVMSIDRPQTTPECPTSRDTPVASGVVPACELTPEIPVPDCPSGPRALFEPGFEGLRIFDVSQPEAPVHIASVPTACGSHTHTTIRDQDDQRAIVYVSSYPTGASPTPTAAADFGGPRCTIPHARISIVEIPDAAPQTARVLKEQFLHADTLPFLGTVGSGGTGAVGCHDITVFYEDQKQQPAGRQAAQAQNPRRVAGAACLEEGQIWDVTQPENPTTLDAHTHIRNPFITSGVPGTFKGLFHTASFTWDGEVLLFTDEWAGGGGHGCDGPGDTRGNVWFYDNVPPGTPQAPLYGRFIIPRQQPPQEACTMHNGNVIPTDEGYFGVSSAYEGGTSVFDFTGVENNPKIFLEHGPQPAEVPPLVAREIAFYDEQGVDGRGKDDVWSSYWYNDRIFANGGLGRQHNPGGRGFDVYKLLTEGGRLLDDQGNPTFGAGDDQNAPTVQEYRARKQPYSNPQTQDTMLKTP